MAEKTFYRPGLVFKAAPKALGHQECCFSGASEIRNADGSLRQEAVRPLWAEFGVWGDEFPYVDPMTGANEIGSDFRGGYFNLDEQAEEKGWTDAEKEIVARHLLTLCERPGRAQFHLHTSAPAQKPWPTYDETHHNQIPQIAAATGTTVLALRYERENKNRESVVSKLEETLRQPIEEELTAA